ncbi:NAD(P)-binding protein [Neurospora crassa]|nr:NAD(P)-binding protein [Neurospora crassa]
MIQFLPTRFLRPSTRTLLSITRTRALNTTARTTLATAISSSKLSRTSLPSSLHQQSYTMSTGTKSASAASHAELNRNSLFNLAGRVALVTGGGTGIGLMATQALAVNGAKVYIAGRNKEKLASVVEIYNKDVEGEIIALQADVTKKEDIAALVKEIESREKCLCILVNNAGISSSSVTTEASDPKELKHNLFDNENATFDDWTETYRTNVASIYFMTSAFLPLLQASTERHPGWSGTVVNISSISGQVKSAQHHFSYNASKAAAVHLNRMLAAEIANAGLKIRINSIAPGVFPSEMTAEESDEFQKSHIRKEKYQDKFPSARPGRDIDMAQAVLALVSNQFINGETLAVDGGYKLAAGL